MTDDTELRMANHIDRTAVEPVVREGVIVLGVLGVTALGTLLPGAGREVPGTEVTLGGVVVSLGTLAVVSSFIYAVPATRELIVASLRGPSEVVGDVASIGGYMVAFAAVLIAHEGFAPVLGSLIDIAWAYDMAFLLFALIPLVAIAYRFVRVFGPLTRLAVGGLFGWGRRSTDSADGEA